jgi:hypothetical protein
LRIRRLEDSFLSGEIERAKRLMDIHGPAGGADDELYRHAGAVRGQPVITLAVAHWVDAIATIELRSTLTQGEHG